MTLWAFTTGALLAVVKGNQKGFISIIVLITFLGL
jgi:hypothetical protein